ncbi:MAG: hypothetical protein Q8T13_02160 [Acidobacteriota bacterium]|nr:hypothetical protein [Acidobacteriota bacterium]
MHSSRLVIAIALVASFACGKSDAEKQAEQAAEDINKAAEAITQAQQQGGDTAKGMADMAKAMQGMAAAVGGGADGKPVEPVATDALKATLPSVSGWTMDAPDAERMTSPIAYSQVETTYKKGDSEIELRVIDTGYAQMLIAPWSMFLASGYSRETGDGYEKSISIGGNPGFEKFDNGSKRGELNIFVNKRFMVSLEGSDLADTKVLHEFASQMDFDKIAALK